MINYDELSWQNKAVIIAHRKGYRCSVDGQTILNTYCIKLRGFVGNNGYRKVTFKYSGKDIHLYNHKLQAYQKFGSRIFKEGIQVRHLNGNPLDNSWNNIEIGTCQENNMDKSSEVRMRSALTATAKVRKFSDAELQNIFNDKYINGFSYTQLMKKYNICSKGGVSFIINKSIFAKNYNLVC